MAWRVKENISKKEKQKKKRVSTMSFRIAAEEVREKTNPNQNK